MNPLLRIKLALIICFTISICLGMTLSSGLQRVRGGPQLAGVMSPPADTPIKPAADRAVAVVPKRIATPSPPAPLWPIRWTTALRLRDLNELAHPEPLLNSPLDLPRRTDELTMVAPAKAAKVAGPAHTGPAGRRGVELIVKTAGDYLRLKQQGFTAKTESDRAMELFAKAQIYPLLFLRRATPARQSFVANFDITANPLVDLPPRLGPMPTPPEQQRVCRLADQGATWKKAFPSAKAVAVDKFTIRITDQAYETRLTLLAWGDFNADGIEDLLVSAVGTARAGQFRSYRLAILTRLRATDPLTVIEVRE